MLLWLLPRGVCSVEQTILFICLCIVIMFRKEDKKDQEPRIIKGKLNEENSCNCTKYRSFVFEWTPTQYEKSKGKGEHVLLSLDEADNESGILPIWLRVKGLVKSDDPDEDIQVEDSDSQEVFLGFRLDSVPKTVTKIIWKVNLWWSMVEKFSEIIISQQRIKAIDMCEFNTLCHMGSLGKTIRVTLRVYLKSNENVMSPLFNKLEELRSKGCLTDVKVVCEGKEFPCHSIVLASMSKVFESMLIEKSEKPNDKTIHIEGFTKEEVEIALKYMYTHEENILQINAPRLLLFASKYDIEVLRFTCENFIMNTLDLRDTLTMLKLAAETNSNNLKKQILGELRIKWSTYKNDASLKKFLESNVLLANEFLYSFN